MSAIRYAQLCPEAKKLLEANGCELIENKKDVPIYSFDELKEVMPDIDGVIAGMDIWNEEVFKFSPKLKVIAKFGVGVDTIDLNAAKSHGIKVINAKGQNSNAVAELAIGFMLNAMRRISIMDRLIRNGEWGRIIGDEISRKTVGLIGFGGIAQLIAEKLLSFNARVVAYDAFPNEVAAKNLNVELLPLDEVLGLSDVVSLHIPGTSENVHFMNAARLSTMKNGAYLINTARGCLIDEKALYDALAEKRLSGAALDVFEKEPVLKDNPLLTLGNVICTPHMGAETYEAYHDVSMSTAAGILDVLNGRCPNNLMNP